MAATGLRACFGRKETVTEKAPRTLGHGWRRGGHRRDLRHPHKVSQEAQGLPELIPITDRFVLQEQLGTRSRSKTSHGTSHDAVRQVPATGGEDGEGQRLEGLVLGAALLVVQDSLQWNHLKTSNR